MPTNHKKEYISLIPQDFLTKEVAILLPKTNRFYQHKKIERFLKEVYRENKNYFFSFSPLKKVIEILEMLQHSLFKIGAELSSDSSKTESIINVIKKNNINEIELLIDSITQSIDLGTEFIMPGTSSSSAAIDISRTVARRLERIVVSINKSDPVNKNILIYLNRISDLLFVLGRLEDKGKNIKKIRGIRKKK